MAPADPYERWGAVARSLRFGQSERVGRRLRTAAELLNPVLADAGFLPAQYGGSPLEPSSVTFCAAFDEFAGRYRQMRQAHEQEFGHGACVDLIIEVDADDRVRRLDLEGHSLEATCRSLGRAQDADSLAKLSVDVLDTVNRLRPILVSLFSTAD